MSGKMEEVKTFDDVLEKVGTTSRYNILVIILCASVGFMTPMQILSSGFLGVTPNYWCQVQELVNANWTAEEIYNFSSPGNESCTYLNYNYSVAADLGYEEVMKDPSLVPMENGTTACSARFFDGNVHSIVTDFDLVCGEEAFASFAVAAAQIGMFVGSLSFGYILDSFGRSFGLNISIIGFIISGLIISLSVNIYMYIVFRIAVTCFGFGMYLGGFVLSMELCSLRHRSLVSSYFVIPWAIGYMMTAMIAFFITSWYYLQVALTLPACILIANIFIVPESPRWLCLQGKHEDALKVLKKFARKNNNELPQDEQMLKILQRVNPVNEEETNSKFSINDWFARWVKPQLLYITPIIFFVWFSVSMVYYGVSLGASTFGLNEYQFIFFGGVLEILSYILIFPGITLLGRRFCIVLTFIVGAGSILAVMGMQIVEYEGIWMSIFSYVGKFMVTAAFHLVYIITGELYPTKLRSLVIGEASVFARCGSILSPFIGLLLGKNVWGPAAFFGAFSVGAGVLSAFLPETKGKKLDQTEETVSHVGSQVGTVNEAFENDQHSRN